MTRRIFLPYPLGFDSPIPYLFERIVPHFPSSEYQFVAFAADESVSVDGEIELVLAPSDRRFRRRFAYFRTAALEPFDLIHTGGWTHLHYPLSHLAHLRNRSLSHIHTFRVDVDPDSEFPTERREKLARMADTTTAVSEHTADTVRREFGIDPVVVYNGVDTELFHPDYSRPTLFEELGLESEVFVFVGSLLRRKRPSHVLDVAERVPDVSFLVIGDGPLESELRQRSKTLENVHLTGRIEKGQLPAIYANATGLLFPTVREGCPNVVLEAMASGAPVVGYEATSMPELVDHSITGYLCDTGEIDQLVQGVEHVTEHRDRMSRAARDYTLTYHQFNRIAERYSRVYAKLE